MSGLLSGLDKFGLEGLEGAILFPEAKKKRTAESPTAKPVVKEADLIFDKGYECPACGSEFRAKTVKMGKAKLAEVEMDLRPRYQNVDPLKYDAVVCPECGYAALTRFFNSLTPVQVRLIKEEITARFKAVSKAEEIYTYEKAIENHKLALVNAMVKKAKSSEKAYICLKLAWIIRGKKEHLPTYVDNYDAIIKESEEEENRFVKNAFEGFRRAIETESFPMCGMDEHTTIYLVAVLAMNTGNYEVASKLVSSVLTDRTASRRIKDKACELKEALIQKIRSSR